MTGPSIPFARVVVHIIMLQRGVRNCALCVREQVGQDQLETSTCLFMDDIALELRRTQSRPISPLSRT